MPTVIGTIHDSTTALFNGRATFRPTPPRDGNGGYVIVPIIVNSEVEDGILSVVLEPQAYVVTFDGISPMYIEVPDGDGPYDIYGLGYGITLDEPQPDDLPRGGNTDDHLVKLSADDWDVGWRPLDPIIPDGLPASGLTGDILTKLSNTDWDVGWATVVIPLPSVQSLRDRLLSGKAVVNEYFYVLGHTTPGDNGGGYFQCKKMTEKVPVGSALYDNNGSIILDLITRRYLEGEEPTYFLRRTDRSLGDPDMLPCPEWYGGFPNAVLHPITGQVTAKTDALFAMMECYYIHSEVNLHRGEYGVGCYWQRNRVGVLAGLFEGQTVTAGGVLVDAEPSWRTYLNINNNGKPPKFLGAGSQKTFIRYLSRPRALPGIGPGSGISTSYTDHFVPGTGQPVQAVRSGFLYLNMNRSITLFDTFGAFLRTYPLLSTDSNSDGAQIEGFTLDLNGQNMWAYNPRDGGVYPWPNNSATLNTARASLGFIQMAPTAMALIGKDMQARDITVQRACHGGQSADERVVMVMSTCNNATNTAVRQVSNLKMSEITFEKPALVDFSRSTIADFPFANHAGLFDAQYVALISRMRNPLVDGAYTSSPTYENIVPVLRGGFPEFNQLMVVASQAPEATPIDGVEVSNVLIRDLPMIRSTAVIAPEPATSNPAPYGTTRPYYSDTLQMPYFQHGMTFYSVKNALIKNVDMVRIQGGCFYHDSSLASGHPTEGGVQYRNCNLRESSGGWSWSGGANGNGTFNNQSIRHCTFEGCSDPTALIYPGATNGTGYPEVIGVSLWADTSTQDWVKFFNRFDISNNRFSYLTPIYNTDAAIRIGCRLGHLGPISISGNKINWLMDRNTPNETNVCNTRNGIQLFTSYPDLPSAYLTGLVKIFDNTSERYGNLIVPSVISYVDRYGTVTWNAGTSAWDFSGQSSINGLATATWITDGPFTGLQLTFVEVTGAAQPVSIAASGAPIQPSVVSQTSTSVRIEFRENDVVVAVPTAGMSTTVAISKGWLYRPEAQVYDVWNSGSYSTESASAARLTAKTDLEPGVVYFNTDDSRYYEYNPVKPLAERVALTFRNRAVDTEKRYGLIAEVLRNTAPVNAWLTPFVPTDAILTTGTELTYCGVDGIQVILTTGQTAPVPGSTWYSKIRLLCHTVVASTLTSIKFVACQKLPSGNLELIYTSEDLIAQWPTDATTQVVELVFNRVWLPAGALFGVRTTTIPGVSKVWSKFQSGQRAEWYRGTPANPNNIIPTINNSVGWQANIYGEVPPMSFQGDSLMLTNHALGAVPANNLVALAAEDSFGLGCLQGGQGGLRTDQILGLIPATANQRGSQLSKIVRINGGVNDLAQGVSKEVFLANWALILNSFNGAGQYVLVSNLTPWNVGTNAQMTTRDDWNAALQVLVSTYSNALYMDHDSVLGQYRAGGTLGNLWDLKPAFNLDGIHLTVLGYQARETHAASLALPWMARKGVVRV